MSRSFKKQPFQAICGHNGAKRDKILAHRGERRANRLAIIKSVKEQDFDSFLAPHKLECAWNEVYSWSRDGNQFYQGLDRYWSRFCQNFNNCYEDRIWPPLWYQQMMRK